MRIEKDINSVYGQSVYDKEIITVAVIDGLTLKIVRGVRYGRITITRLS